MQTETRKKFIDVDKVLLDKSPKLYKVLPRFMINYFKRLFHQDDLNNDLWVLRDKAGVEKFDEFLKMRNIKLNIVGVEHIQKDGKYVFASNHPLGGPDGVIFGSAMGQIFPNIRFLVNDVLMNIPNMEGFFIPINKMGANNRASTIAVDEAYASDKIQVLIFPAGMVSRKQKGVIKDLQWNKNFVAKAKQHNRDVVPVYISGKNSNFFYNLARLRTKLGIKANIEMLFLIKEFYKHKNETINVYLGKPIPYSTFDNSKKPLEWAAYVKEIAYELPNQYKFHTK